MTASPRLSRAAPSPRAARAPHRLVQRLRPVPLALALLLAHGPHAIAAAAGDAAAKAEPAARATSQAPAAAPPGEAADLDRLRQRLAEKLGATSPAPGAQPGLVRLTTRPEAAPAGVATPAVPPVRKPAVLAAQAPLRAVAPPPRRGPWSYGGESGPAFWAELDPAFALCAKGRRQSPIDIRGGVAVDLEPIRFDYRPSAFAVFDDGHTILARIAPGNTIEVGARRFELRQLHFHHPAEERIEGRGFDMSLHLVHEDAQGRLAVLALLLQRGDEPQEMVQRVWNDLPLEKGVEQPASRPLDPAALLPAERGYATYMGSLTSPPCSEDVLWMVMRQPLSVTQAQIDVFTHLYPMNARPLQSAAGRLIKRSP